MSNRCPNCFAPIRYETSAFTEFRCGAGFYPESGNAWECDEANRAQRIEDNDDLKDDMKRTDQKGATA